MTVISGALYAQPVLPMADHSSQSRLLLRAMTAKDADMRATTSPADMMKGRGDNPACGQHLETLAGEVRPQPFRITVEDAEVVKEPFSVSYKLAVHSAQGEHTLNKGYNDLEHFGKALVEELPTVILPKLPRPHAHEQLVDRGFRARLGAYLVCLACNQSVVETFAFKNFFQLADDATVRALPPTQEAVARMGHALLAGALGSLGLSSGFDKQEESKPVSFPPTRAVPAGSVKSRSTMLPVVFAASAFRSVAAGRQGMGERHGAHTAPGKLPLQAGMGGSISPVNESMNPISPVNVSRSMGLPAGQPERNEADGDALPSGAGRASTREGRPATGISPLNLSRSVGLPAGPPERNQADGDAPPSGASRASTREGRPATSPTALASTRVPLDSRVPQGTTFASATSPTAMAPTQVPPDSGVPQGPTSPEPSATPAITRPNRRKTTRGRAWCVVCLENPQEMAIDPCGHMSMCEECMKTVKDCPICRGPIHKAMKIIIAKRHQSGATTEYVSS